MTEPIDNYDFEKVVIGLYSENDLEYEVEIEDGFGVKKVILWSKNHPGAFIKLYFDFDKQIWSERKFIFDGKQIPKEEFERRLKLVAFK